jgi:hypothetical protein
VLALRGWQCVLRIEHSGKGYRPTIREEGAGEAVSKGPFLAFDKIEPPETRKTDVWRVASAKGNDFLGIVEWYAPWRRYVFCNKAHEMVFDFACLTEIAGFISDRMTERSHKTASKQPQG